MSIEELKGYPIIYKQIVAWGDMDAFGHVNNVQYYRYIESARIEYFEHFNIFALDIYTVISKSSCRYLSPVFYPDTLYVGARIDELRNSAMRMSYVLYSEKQGKVVADGDAVIVCLDNQTHQKALIPEALKTQILQFEEKAQHKISNK